MCAASTFLSTASLIIANDVGLRELRLRGARAVLAHVA